MEEELKAKRRYNLNATGLVGLPVSSNEREGETGAEVGGDTEGKSGLVLGREGNVLFCKRVNQEEAKRKRYGEFG